MSLAKVAQVIEDTHNVDGELEALFVDDEALFVDDDLDFADDMMFGNDEMFGDDNDLQGEIVVQVGDDEPVVREFEFSLPQVPGGDSQDDIEEPAELEVEEEEDVDEDLNVIP